MNQTIKKWEIRGIVFLILIGSLFHFLFELTGFIQGLEWLWPVNESVWEHLKMVFFPLMIWLIIEYRYIKTESKNLFIIKLLQILLQFGIILGVFYTYTAFVNDTIVAIDITSFFIGIIIGQFLSIKFLEKFEENKKLNILGLCGIIILLILFITFTYFPPHIFLFKDNNANTYGIVYYDLF